MEKAQVTESVRVTQLKQQLAYQKQKLAYTLERGNSPEKVEYHKQKIEYIEKQLENHARTLAFVENRIASRQVEAE